MKLGEDYKVMNTIKAKKAMLVTTLSALALVGFMAVGSPKNAAATAPWMGLACSAPGYSTNVNGATLPANTQVQCHTIDTNSYTNHVHYWVKDPMGNVLIDYNNAYTPNTDLKFHFVATTAGKWSVESDFTGVNGHDERYNCDINITFFVLPESSIGAVAIMGSSMAALGGFVGLRKLKATPKEATA